MVVAVKLVSINSRLYILTCINRTELKGESPKRDVFF